MATITLLRKSTKYDKNNQSYRMILEVTGSEDITQYVFVNQRLRDFIKNNFDDVFAAVATPAQLEDFDVNSPKPNSSYYLTNTIDLVDTDLSYLEDIFTIILTELQLLAEDYEGLNNLQPDGIYTITADNIDINMAILHTHYRLPLRAAPCGTNNIYTDGGGIVRQSVGSQNTSVEGWLNTSDTDPAGYKFKYNIVEDSSVNNLWPPSSDKIGYAHLEVNGISQSSANVLITSAGIFWLDNKLGYAPFAEDYVNSEDLGNDPPVLVLDIIV